MASTKKINSMTTALKKLLYEKKARPLVTLAIDDDSEVRIIANAGVSREETEQLLAQALKHMMEEDGKH